MSASQVTLLETLSTQLSNEEFDAARSTVADLESLYRDLQDDEVERVEQSQAVYLDVDQEDISVEEAAELNAFSGTAGGTQFLRALVLTVATTIVESNEELAAEGKLTEVTDVAQVAIDELLQSENRFEEQTTSTQEVLDTATIPPSVRITVDSVDQRSISVDDETVIRSRVKNVGESTADGVGIQVGSTSGITPETESRTIGSLSASEEIEVTLRVVGGETGSQSIDLQVDSSNAGTDLATVVFTVQESGPPPVGDFENPPTDPDGDGLYEDINGDGTFDTVDVQALFANLDDPAIQNNPDAFDFNGDGQVDVVDVQRLFNEL